jgi:hypothetical protein
LVDGGWRISGYNFHMSLLSLVHVGDGESSSEQRNGRSGQTDFARREAGAIYWIIVKMSSRDLGSWPMYGLSRPLFQTRSQSMINMTNKLLSFLLFEQFRDSGHSLNPHGVVGDSLR